MLMKDGGGKQLTLNAKMPVKPIKESYTMIGGKRHECSNEGNEITYLYIDNIGRKQSLTVRAYNDGVAFRYEFDGLQQSDGCRNGLSPTRSSSPCQLLARTKTSVGAILLFSNRQTMSLP